jgi:hypothetical protein
MADSEQKTPTLPFTPLVRQLLAGGGTAVVLAYCAYQLLISQPQNSFALLREWGPRPLLTLVLCYFAWVLGKMVIAQMKEMSDAVRQAAVAAATAAAALAEMAAKDDRQAEVMRLLTQDAARTAGRAVELLQEQAVKLDKVTEKLSRMPCHEAIECSPRL